MGERAASWPAATSVRCRACGPCGATTGRSQSISIRQRKSRSRTDNGESTVALVATAVEAVEAGRPRAAGMLRPPLTTLLHRLGLSALDLVVQLLLVVIIICRVHSVVPLLLKRHQALFQLAVLTDHASRSSAKRSVRTIPQCGPQLSIEPLGIKPSTACRQRIVGCSFGGQGIRKLCSKSGVNFFASCKSFDCWNLASAFRTVPRLRTRDARFTTLQRMGRLNSPVLIIL